MKRKWSLLILAVLAVAVLILTRIPSEADAAGNGSAFRVEAGRLIAYEGTDAEVVIPGTVTEIEKSAFQNNQYVETIHIPKSVEKIGPYAFWGCTNLKEITGGEGLYEIGDFVAANCIHLTQWQIPSNVKRIGIMAFGDDVNMKYMEIPYTVTSIHDTAFDGCGRLSLTVYPGSEGDRFSKVFAVRKEGFPQYEEIPEEEQQPAIEKPVATPAVTPEPTPTPYVEEEEQRILGETRVVANKAVVFIDNKEETVQYTNPQDE